ncbi:hypothetical protein PR048_030809 [Dryococelus australis]|uniref:Uncharacterized protein n=1 Tax=Dryococelus australis TaxID=614101 RepID=A0ABQ9GAP1_9NEOP|nr:hypothetical protein PR048_030809 [Dryococelus australis]
MHSGAAPCSPRFALIGSQDMMLRDTLISSRTHSLFLSLIGHTKLWKYAPWGLIGYRTLRSIPYWQGFRLAGRERKEQSRNARLGETGYPRENPPTTGIIRHDSHTRKSGSDPAGVGGGTVAKRLACSPPTKANRVQTPAGPPDIRKWESCRTMPLVGGFSRASPVSPASSFRRRSIFTSITLIGSQDLADKIDVKHVYTEVDFAIGSQFIRHALDDSEPVTDLQGN